MNRTVAVGADHLGFELKEVLRRHLEEQGYEVRDFGVHDTTPIDYPDVAGEVAKAIRRGEFDRAVLVCGTGAGMAIAANKVPGVRAVAANDPYTAERARKSNDAQVITMGSRVVTPTIAVHLLDLWLASEFEGGGSTEKVRKIGELERQHHLETA